MKLLAYLQTLLLTSRPFLGAGGLKQLAHSFLEFKAPTCRLLFQSPFPPLPLSPP
jgi:hypothetical protein